MNETTRRIERNVQSVSAFHEDEMASFARPGDWLTGEERAAVVRHARQVRAAAGLQDADANAGPAPADVLPAATLALVRRVALDPAGLDRRCLEDARTGSMSEEEYVETVGLVARVINVDVFARGIGVTLPALPEPSDGEPALHRPAAVHEGAWVPTVPFGPAGGADAAAIYGGEGMQPFIYRALSLAPGEARRTIEGGNLQYTTLDRFFAFDYSAWPALTRPQVEALAARVSALNGCFY